MEKIPFDGKTNCGIYLTLNIEGSLFKKEKKKGTLNFQNMSVHIYYYSRIIRGKRSIYLSC